MHVVIEAPPDSPRVLIRTLIPGFTHHPTEWIGVEKLIRLDDADAGQAQAGRCTKLVRRPASCDLPTHLHPDPAMVTLRHGPSIRSRSMDEDIAHLRHAQDAHEAPDLRVLRRHHGEFPHLGTLLLAVGWAVHGCTVSMV